MMSRLSNFAFDCNLRHYTQVFPALRAAGALSHLEARPCAISLLASSSANHISVIYYLDQSREG
jgi:hypothetical protein